MNFCVDFGAKDAGRLTPFKDDKPKDTENSPFEASSVLVVKAILCITEFVCYLSQCIRRKRIIHNRYYRIPYYIPIIPHKVYIKTDSFKIILSLNCKTKCNFFLTRYAFLRFKSFSLYAKKYRPEMVCIFLVGVTGHSRFASYILADPNASHFGTRLRNISLKNLPPATFS